ncbi:MAG: YwqG family protein [Coriobacteriia bacterium]|nr:YwqG family protein [Coriobacteriia bacterium]
MKILIGTLLLMMALTLIIVFSDGPQALLEREWIIFMLTIAVLGAAFSLTSLLNRRKYDSSTGKDLPELEPREIEAMKDLLKQKEVPCVKLTPVRRSTGIFESKFGGAPYLPPGFEYPHEKGIRRKAQALKLLCQLNLAELPPLPGFPQKGMLQFYLPSREGPDPFGADFGNPTEQRAWRAVYHPEVITDKSLLGSPPDSIGEDSNFPFKGEFALEMEQSLMPIQPYDYGWKDFKKNILKPSPMWQSLIDKYKEKDLIILMQGMLERRGCRVGGYPYFTQSDPRFGGGTIHSNHSVLLLQIDGDEQALWVEGYIANFIIAPKALEGCDFSDVIYTWESA